MNYPPFRTATAQDAAAIVALVNTAFRVERFFIEGERTNPEHVHTLLQTGVFLLAEAAGQLIGCVYVEIRGERGERGYFGLLAVDPAHQRTGLGSHLVAAAEGHCRAAGCSVMELQTVNVRTELPGIYRRLGYEVCGTAPFVAAHQPKIPCHFVKMEKLLLPTA